jgi:hypothetical protein
MDVLNAFRSPEKAPESYTLPISSRIHLYKLTEGEANEDHTKQIAGLYDLANNHGHLNLRFPLKSSQDSAQYTEIILDLIEEILTETTEIMLKRFGQWSLLKDFMSFTKSLEDDEFAFVLVDDDDDDDEDQDEDEFDSDICRITIHPDYETPEHAGASGFQVIE